MENGWQKSAERIELQDKIVVESGIANGPETQTGERFEFEVVGIVEDSETRTRYAVCYSERADEFIVTDDVGQLLEDDALAQSLLNDFLEQAEGPEGEG